MEGRRESEKSKLKTKEKEEKGKISESKRNKGEKEQQVEAILFQCSVDTVEQLEGAVGWCSEALGVHFLGGKRERLFELLHHVRHAGDDLDQQDERHEPKQRVQPLQQRIHRTERKAATTMKKVYFSFI